MTRFVVIASGKGGVGKTTTTLNLASALQNFGREAIVLDANITTPNICLHLGTPSLPVTLQDALRGKKHIKDAVYLHPSGLKIIPSSISLEENPDELLENLKHVVPELKDSGEVVLIDAAAGLGSEAVHALRVAHDAIIVSSPDIPSVTDALKTIKRAEKEGTKVLGVVVTKVRNDNLELSITNIETILEKPVIGIIPYDQSIRKSLHLKNPVLYTHPESRASVAYKKLAANLIGQRYVESFIEREGLFNYVLKKLGFRR
ncbi:P-loop NTPase [Candidatus Woesearchaeota archaeon]|nr:P-loop NTPase [Candidatus Woesearchaeota archaeon]